MDDYRGIIVNRWVVFEILKKRLKLILGQSDKHSMNVVLSLFYRIKKNMRLDRIAVISKNQASRGQIKQPDRVWAVRK